MNYLRYGENGIRIVCGDSIDIDTHKKVRSLYFFLKSMELPGVIEIIPSFCSCLVCFDTLRASFDRLTQIIAKRTRERTEWSPPAPNTHEIPVMYGGDYGPDMRFVSEYTGLTEEEVIEIHTSSAYTVFMVGFLPGFPYLGPLDKRLYVPRLETPKMKTLEGSVGLAQFQTGIYPFESPSGWRIIGKTSVRLFDPLRQPYSIFQIGDTVRFVRS